MTRKATRPRKSSAAPEPDTPRADPQRPGATESGLPVPQDLRAGYVPLLYPPTSGKVRGIALADWAFAWSCHWHDGRTFPHRIVSEDCPGCRAGQLARWSAYLPVLTLPDRRQRLMMISFEAWVNCRELSLQQGRLRGATIHLARTGTARQGRVVASFEATKPSEGLPDTFDPRPVLERLWGVKEGWLAAQGYSLAGDQPPVEPHLPNERLQPTHDKKGGKS